MVNQNLDAQNCPDNLAPFNESLQNQVTVWIRLYCLPGCLSEFWTKKDETDAMEDQNLDAQNCPNDSAPFKSRLLRESVFTVCPAAYQNFDQIKTRLTPQWTRILTLRTAPTIQPLSMNHYKSWLLLEFVYTVCLAAYQNFEQKKTKPTPWKNRRSEPPRWFSPF